MSQLAARIKAGYPAHVLRDVAIPAAQAVAATARANAPINSTGRPCEVALKPLPLGQTRAAVSISSTRIPDRRWVHGFIGQPGSPFDPHFRLDTLVTDDIDTDERFTTRAQDAWIGGHYFPQDHRGCLCGLVPDLQDQFITDAVATWPDAVAAVVG